MQGPVRPLCLDWDVAEYWALTLLGVAAAGLAAVAAYYSASEARTKASVALIELAAAKQAAEQEDESDEED